MRNSMPRQTVLNLYPTISGFLDGKGLFEWAPRLRDYIYESLTIWNHLDWKLLLAAYAQATRDMVLEPAMRPGQGRKAPTQAELANLEEKAERDVVFGLGVFYQYHNGQLARTRPDFARALMETLLTIWKESPYLTVTDEAFEIIVAYRGGDFGDIFRLVNTDEQPVAAGKIFRALEYLNQGSGDKVIAKVLLLALIRDENAALWIQEALRTMEPLRGLRDDGDRKTDLETRVHNLEEDVQWLGKSERALRPLLSKVSAGRVAGAMWANATHRNGKEVTVTIVVGSGKGLTVDEFEERVGYVIEQLQPEINDLLKLYPSGYLQIGKMVGSEEVREWRTFKLADLAKPA